MSNCNHTPYDRDVEDYGCGICLKARLAEAEALLRGIRHNFYMAQQWADRIDAHLARGEKRQ